MKSVVRWSVDNTPALNVAMIALLAAGVVHVFAAARVLALLRLG